ncbi:hypothetical protein DENSPDRAFT_500053 [Dentipellis sp. KUC8613]|nr:hypothetical protein DENSPDRAFT_500053 [Dentipellis sp. KUC8613]
MQALWSAQVNGHYDRADASTSPCFTSGTQAHTFRYESPCSLLLNGSSDTMTTARTAHTGFNEFQACRSSRAYITFGYLADMLFPAICLEVFQGSGIPICLALSASHLVRAGRFSILVLPTRMAFSQCHLDSYASRAPHVIAVSCPPGPDLGGLAPPSFPHNRCAGTVPHPPGLVHAQAHALRLRSVRPSPGFTALLLFRASNGH